MDNKLVTLLKKTRLFKYYRKYKDKQLYQENLIRNRYFMAEGEDLLRHFADTLNSEGIIFWLEFGTLLGYYRENDFIPHDCDLDMGARIEDAPEIRSSLIRSGFKLIDYYTSSDGGLEECYKYRNTCIDIFYFREDKDSNTLYCNSFVTRRYLFKKHRKTLKCFVKRVDYPVSEFIKVTFKGAQVYIPSDTIEHLEWSYGKNFMTPDPDFDSRTVATNITYYQYAEVSGILHVSGNKI